MSSDNERALGTFLGTEHDVYKVVANGDLYTGEAEILGENYYTAYQPIKDKNNNVIGLLFIGMPTKALDRVIEVNDEKMSKINILIVVLRTISLGSLIAVANASATRTK